MDLNELLNQTITEETPEAVQIELEPKVEVKESEDKNIFLILNESTGEQKVGFNDVYELELANDLEILEAVQERINKKKEEIKAFIESNKLGSFKTDKLIVNYTSATTTTSIDTTKLKKELPDIAATYSKVSARSSSVSIKENK